MPQPRALTALAFTVLVVSALGAAASMPGSKRPLGPPRPKAGESAAPIASAVPQLARYIVVLRGTLLPRERELVKGHVRMRVLGGTPSRDLSRAAAAGTPKVHHELTGALHGLVATMSPAAAAELQMHPGVALVEPDQRLDMQPLGPRDARVRRTVEGPEPADGDGAGAAAPADRGSWALDVLCRAHDAHVAANGTAPACPGRNGGAGVDVYVIDSGVAEVSGLAGRVVHGYSLFSDFADCVNHGTMVASHVAGSELGIARGATIVNVKVFGCSSGYVTSLVSGLSYVAAAAAASGRPSVAIITSSTASPSVALNQAVEATVNAGVVVVVSAGHNGDSCSKSPASEQTAITVSSLAKDGAAAVWGGTGVCVDLYAPGEDVLTVRANDAKARVTGAGMSAAAVAGVAAVVRGMAPEATVEEVTNAVLCEGALGVIDHVPERTANLLAQLPVGDTVQVESCDVEVPPVESCDDRVCHGHGECYQGREFMCTCDCGYFGRTCESDMGMRELALKGTFTGTTKGGVSYGGHPSAEMYFTIDIPASSTAFELSLCSPDTDFDTYVWVVASCPSFSNIGFFSFLDAVAINDDGLAGGCPVKHPDVWFPPSEIGPVKLSAGRYTIVVEGHGYEEGTFTMTWDAHVAPLDCIVSEWTDWTECSEPCAGGVRTRQREVVREARFGGTPCPAATELKVQEACNQHDCSNGCVVTQWGDWGDCTVTCGGGFRQRFRSVITQPQVGHGSCPPLSEDQFCAEQSCADRCAGVECPAAEECFVAGGCDSATGECLPPVPVTGCVPADDECPDDQAKTQAGECGCGAADTDTDGDGVADCLDSCPLSAVKVYPGVCGCDTADTESDGDGIPDCDDHCPNDPDKTHPAACGCGVADADSDGDHTADCQDECPNDAAKVAPGICGCGHADTDADGDGVVDCLDACPYDGAKTDPGECGCFVSDADADSDGVVDCHDQCPADDNKSTYGMCGCGTPETDADSDGHVDCFDDCPSDADKYMGGVCGCGVPDTDTDGDGTPDCDDACPADATHVGSGVCGCGVMDVDTDGDGVFDCLDECKYDPHKTSPGSCGCGAVDTDTDGDGHADCVDGCDNDAQKQAPGVCGCGVPDVDSDTDGTPDCNDGCQHDATKVDPGACGCGISDHDTDGDEVSDCFDGCENDPLKAEPGHCGCGVPDHDGDGDGTLDCQDGCPTDPLKVAPLTCGCGAPELDTDHDGVTDCTDGCPHDVAKTAPGQCGCGVSDEDSDGDGSPDCLDGCAADAHKTEPAVCGCGIPDVDTDGDGTLDCREECHQDASKAEPGACGCGVPDTDSDADGTADCVDGCAADAAKVAPGVCGCGKVDADRDHDGVADCFDSCPEDPLKAEPGVCGCGVGDHDSDGDGVVDCNDECAHDTHKSVHGVCGCGVPDDDQDGDSVPDCVDSCPRDAAKSVPGMCGCGASDVDTDGDSVPDCFDGCDADATKFLPGECGCGVPDEDGDGDGVLNCKEQCPADANKQARGACGCGVPDADTDGDGTPDCNDGCPLSPAKSGPGECGCGLDDVDTDGDLVLDCKDMCPHDAAKRLPGVCGCGIRDKDSDGDGTPDCNDACPVDPLKAAPGDCGCGVSDTDTDGDGTPNCADACPADAGKVAAGVCGCGTPDTDSDKDGTAACHDMCDQDAGKLLPGVCGCGVPDTDTDADGTPDCVDLCPASPGKTDAGECGCDLADADSDGDGTPDCVDTCPQDAGKVQRGQCGCGVVDTDSDGDGVADCVEPCTMQPCHNGGLCIDGHGSYTCSCRKYFTGPHCLTALDPCEGVVCPAAPSDCYTNSVCDASSGEPVCIAPKPRASGSACDDGNPATTPDRCALNHCLGATQWSPWGSCFSYCGDAAGAARRVRSRLIFSPDAVLQTDFESCVGYTCPATVTTMVLAVDSDLPLLTTGTVTDAVQAAVLQALVTVAGDARASNAVYVEAMATVTPVTQAAAQRRLAPTLAAHHATLRIKYATSGSVDAAAVVSTAMQQQLLATSDLAQAVEASSPLPLQVASISVVAVSVQIEALLDDTGAPVLLQGEPDIATRPPGAPPKENDLHKVALDSGNHGLDAVVNGGDDNDGFNVGVVRGTPLIVVVLGGLVVLAVLVVGVAGVALYTRARRGRNVTLLARRVPHSSAREAASGAEAVPLKSASDDRGGGGWSPGGGAAGTVVALPLEASRGSEWHNGSFGSFVLPAGKTKTAAPLPDGRAAGAGAWNRPVVQGMPFAEPYGGDGAGAGPDTGGTPFSASQQAGHVTAAVTTVTALPEPALMPDGTYSYASVGWDDEAPLETVPTTVSPRKHRSRRGSQHRNPLAQRRPSISGHRRTAPAGPPPGVAKAKGSHDRRVKSPAPMPSPRRVDAGRFGSSDSVASTNAWGGADVASSTASDVAAGDADAASPARVRTLPRPKSRLSSVLRAVRSIGSPARRTPRRCNSIASADADVASPRSVADSVEPMPSECVDECATPTSESPTTVAAVQALALDAAPTRTRLAPLRAAERRGPPSSGSRSMDRRPLPPVTGPPTGSGSGSWID